MLSHCVTYLRQHLDVSVLNVAVRLEVDVAQTRSGEEEGVGGGDHGEELVLLRLVVHDLRLALSAGKRMNG